MHVDFYNASDLARGRRVDVGGAPAAVPVVGRRVLVCDGYNCNLGVILDGEYAGASFGVVFCGMCPKALDQALSMVCPSAQSQCVA